MTMPKITALVPMRHHSERVPEKNFRPLAGKPLYSYILHTLLKVEQVEQIVVDTDSLVIKRGLAEDFPSVVVLDRPEHLTAPEISMNEILRWDVGRLDSEHFLQTHSTNPLLTADTVTRAILAYFEGLEDHDALFSVTAVRKRYWAADRTPVNHDPTNLIQTQALPPLFEENSCLYLFSRTALIETGIRLGRNPMLFEIPADEAWDIDEEKDFRLVECLLTWREVS